MLGAIPDVLMTKRKKTSIWFVALLLLSLESNNRVRSTEAFTGWVDPDTIEADKTRISYSDGQVYDIIMSDEFNKDGRKFKDGVDPMWTGIDKSDDDQTSTGRKSLQFYNSSNIFTENGNLVS